ncbi:unnamed protein product [Clonostachys chloroleuca]|uniref:Uncharacterized protein n=1 Tax=Clonostachys chloroleuca TaxID=1926264 RepID=A0AA35MHR6_9HYPO|nr:unnamed protein product [Clonostachys chloroleuca]
MLCPTSSLQPAATPPTSYESLSNRSYTALCFITRAPYPPLPTAFGRLKGTAVITVLVSDKDFSLLKPSHIINAIPPPALAAEVF